MAYTLYGTGDFECGCLDVADSTVSGDTITLQPQLVGSGNNWRNLVAKLTGASGNQPTFKIPWSGHDTDTLSDVISEGWLPCYTYTIDDYTSWVYASSASDDGSGNLQFTFDSAFSQDTVYIAMYPVMRPSYIHSIMSSLTNVAEPTSSTNYGGDTYQYAEIASTTDEEGNTIPAQKLYCYKLGSGSTKVVLTGCVHAQEHLGSIALMESVKWLDADSKAAKQARSDFTFYIYPVINSQGRYGGHFRYTFESGELNTDPNRDWAPDRFNLDCDLQTKDAIDTDVGVTAVDMFMDCHDKRDAGNFYHFGDTTNTTNFFTWYKDVQLLGASTGGNPSSNTVCDYFYQQAGADPCLISEMGLDEYDTDEYLASRRIGIAQAFALTKLQRSVYTGNQKNGIDFGASNTGRYYYVSSAPNDELSLPDSEWCVGFWMNMDTLSGSEYQFWVSSGGWSANDSLNVAIDEGDGQIWCEVEDSSGNPDKTLYAPISEPNSTNTLVVVQRTSINKFDRMRLFTCQEGGRITLHDDVPSPAAVTLGDLYMGIRSDLAGTRAYDEHMGGLFKGDFGLELEEIELIAWGFADPSEYGPLGYYFQMNSPDATLVDRVNGIEATQNGSSWPSPSVAFAYAPTGGTTVGVGLAWQIFNTNDIASSWHILAQISQASSWSIFNTLDENTAWKILVTKDQATAWQILVSGLISQSVAWQIATSTSQVSSWQIKDDNTVNTSYRIFNTLPITTAWEIFGSVIQDPNWQSIDDNEGDTTWNVLTNIQNPFWFSIN